MISHLGINGPRLFANLRSMKSRRLNKNHGRPDLRLDSFNHFQENWARYQNGTTKCCL